MSKYKKEFQKYSYTSPSISKLVEDINGSPEYEQGAHFILEEITNRRLLPSSKQIGDKVNVAFGYSGPTINNGTIIRIHFDESSVRYDVEIKEQIEFPEKGDNVTASY